MRVQMGARAFRLLLFGVALRFRSAEFRSVFIALCAFLRTELLLADLVQIDHFAHAAMIAGPRKKKRAA